MQHPREARHPFGTVRLARLGLTGVDVRVPDREDDDRLVCTGSMPAGAALLYPTADSVDIREMSPIPTSLVIVDGTWSTARKLLRDDPALAALPRVHVLPPRPGNYRIRRAPNPAQQVSTIEATLYALQAIEGDRPEFRALLAAFDRMVDRQLALQRATA